MKTDEAKQIPITDLITKLNYKPTNEQRGDAWHYSPFHEENTPSFKVTRQNLWYDFSILSRSYARRGCRRIQSVMPASPRHACARRNLDVASTGFLRTQE